MPGLSPTSLSPSCSGWVYPGNHWASDQIPNHAGTGPLGPTQLLIQTAPRCGQRHIAALCAGAMNAFHLLQTFQSLPARPQRVGDTQNPTKPMKQEVGAGQALGSSLGVAVPSHCSCSSAQRAGTQTGRALGLPTPAVLERTWSHRSCSFRWTVPLGQQLGLSAEATTSRICCGLGAVLSAQPVTLVPTSSSLVPISQPSV